MLRYFRCLLMLSYSLRQLMIFADGARKRACAMRAGVYDAMRGCGVLMRFAALRKERFTRLLMRRHARYARQYRPTFLSTRPSLDARYAPLPFLQTAEAFMRGALTLRARRSVGCCRCSPQPARHAKSRCLICDFADAMAQRQKRAQKHADMRRKIYSPFDVFARRGGDEARRRTASFSSCVRRACGGARVRDVRPPGEVKAGKGSTPSGFPCKQQHAPERYFPSTISRQECNFAASFAVCLPVTR